MTSLLVSLSDDADGLVIADAIRIEEVIASGPEIQVRSPLSGELRSGVSLVSLGSVERTSLPVTPVDTTITIQNAGDTPLNLR